MRARLSGIEQDRVELEEEHEMLCTREKPERMVVRGRRLGRSRIHATVCAQTGEWHSNSESAYNQRRAYRLYLKYSLF